MKPPTKIAFGLTGIQRQLAVSPQPLSKPSMEAVAAKPSLAVKKSRAKNPEAYRAYQREYMRKRRAKNNS